MTCKVATWLIKWLHDVVMWLHKVVMWLHKVVMWLHKLIMWLHVTGSMNLATILCDHSCSHVTSCHQLSYSCDYFRSQIWFTWVWMLGTSSRWWYGLGTFGKLHNQSEPRTLHFQTFIIKDSSVNFNTCWITGFLMYNNWLFFYVFIHRESFLESLGIDFRQLGTLIDPTIEEDLQKTWAYSL